MADATISGRFGGIRGKVLMSFVLFGVAISGLMSSIFYLRMRGSMETQLDTMAKLNVAQLALASYLPVIMNKQEEIAEVLKKTLADGGVSGVVYGGIVQQGKAIAEACATDYKGLSIMDGLEASELQRAILHRVDYFGKNGERLWVYAAPLGGSGRSSKSTRDENAQDSEDVFGGGADAPSASEAPTPAATGGNGASTRGGEDPVSELAVMAFSTGPLAGRMRNDVALWGGLALIVAIAGGLVITLVLDSLIVKPIKETTQIALKIAGGSLSERAPVRSRDEVGVLGDAFNRMADSLQEQLVRSEEMSRSMQSAMERSNILVENVAQAIQQLSGSTSSILAVSAEQASGAAEQAASVQEANTTSEEIATMARMISDNASSMEGTAESMVSKCQEGLKVVQDAIKAMQDIRTQVDLLQENMIGLNENSQQVNEIVETINWFADQTNLVALNASIEAVGAGDAGIRFGAVANELRELARNINEQTRQIRERAAQIQTSIASTVVATENGAKRVEMGAEVTGRVRESFEGIMVLVTKAVEAIKHIHVSTKQQEGACSEMASNIAGVASVATQVAQNAEQTERSMNDLDQLAARLRQLLAEEQ